MTNSTGHELEIGPISQEQWDKVFEVLDRYADAEVEREHDAGDSEEAIDEHYF